MAAKNPSYLPGPSFLMLSVYGQGGDRAEGGYLPPDSIPEPDSQRAVERIDSNKTSNDGEARMHGARSGQYGMQPSSREGYGYKGIGVMTHDQVYAVKQSMSQGMDLNTSIIHAVGGQGYNYAGNPPKAD